MEECYSLLGIDNRTVVTAYLAHADVLLGNTARAMILGSIQSWPIAPNAARWFQISEKYVRISIYMMVSII